MKNKNLKFILSVSVILSGLMYASYFYVHGEEESSGAGSEKQVQTAESYRAASISKETILALFAVGIIGALGVNRKKRDSITPPHQKDNGITEGHQNLDTGEQKPIARKY